MKNIVGLNFTFPSHDDEDHVPLTGRTSLSHADIVLLNPDNRYVEGYFTDPSSSQYQGKQLYDDSSSFSLVEDSHHWQSEISSLLSTGKTVFVLLCGYRDFYIHTGERQTSGTGRNQKVTQIVDKYDNYRLLPLSFSFRAARGRVIYAVDDLVKPMFNSLKSKFVFRDYILGDNYDRPLFCAGDRTSVVGAIKSVGKGHLILLPDLRIDYDEFTNQRTGGWKKNGLQFGHLLKQCLLEIDKTLRHEIKQTPRLPGPLRISMPSRVRRKQETKLRASTMKLRPQK